MRAALVQEWHRAMLAVQFLTRLRVPPWPGFSAEHQRRCVRYFAPVGALVGLAGAAVALAAGLVWPAPVAATLSVLATVWLTAAFHEDGLADSADALWGAAPAARALAIMKDSRIGTYGAAALVLSLMLRVTLLAELMADAVLVAAALVAAHAVGRAAAVALMASLPDARAAAGAPGTGRAAAPLPGVRPFDVIATSSFAIVTLAVLAALGGGLVAFIAALGMVAVVGLVFRRLLSRRLGGCTGDTLGAMEQMAECVVLLVAAARGLA